MRVLGILLAVALFVLAVLNPGPSDFEAFAQTQSAALIQNETGDTAIGRVLAEAGSAIASRFIRRHTDRTNYVLFSVYTLDLDGEDASGGDWRFLGIADHFVELERPEQFQRRR